jgi:hypothetical protein
LHVVVVVTVVVGVVVAVTVVDVKNTVEVSVAVVNRV